VQLIAERDGVISAVGTRIEGGIRMLKGLDIQVQPSDAGTREPDPEATAKKWGCTDVRCNVYKIDPNDPDVNCPERVIGNSAYIYSTQKAACDAAKDDANSKVPRGCNKRHCNCNTKCSQR
jgi:hypothetical protein